MGTTTITQTHTETDFQEIVVEGIADKDHKQWRTKWKSIIASI